MSLPAPVRIHYRRPPDRLDVYEQSLLVDEPNVLVSFQASAPIERAVRVAGSVVLEPGAPVVWFTFPGRWHDIGRFHTAAGVFTGYYANVLTPPTVHALPPDRQRGRDVGDPGRHWETTDLFLDVWLSPAGRTSLLDEDQFLDALARGWLSDEFAVRARREADDILSAHARGEWPPPIVYEWTLARARRALAAGAGEAPC